MGVFSGMEILFYGLGILTAVLGIGLIRLRQLYQFGWYVWFLLGSGMGLAIFTLAWLASSFLEGEIQAGNMGLLVFGVPVLIIFSLAKRSFSKTNSES